MSTQYTVSVVTSYQGNWVWPFDYRLAANRIMPEGRAEALVLLHQMASLLNAERGQRELGMDSFWDFTFKEERLATAFQTVAQEAGFRVYGEAS